MSSDGPLACPRCATKHGLDERFCSRCGMPLVYAGRAEQEPITAAHERARKVKPQYTGGQLVKVTGGRNQAEAEMIQGMLLEEGIPSIARRTRGFDVPDFLAAGPRDILVPESALEDSRRLLSIPPGEANASLAAPPPGSAARLALWVLIGAGAALLVVWLFYQAAT